MATRLPVLLFLVVGASRLSAQPQIGAVVNAASLQPNLSPGTLATVFGTQLAPAAAAAAGFPLPTKLNGVSVTIGAFAAPLLYVSPNQINFLVPFEVGDLRNAKAQISIDVSTAAGSSSNAGTFLIPLSRSAPALFTKNSAGTGDVIAFDAAQNPLQRFDGRPIVLYATGLGPTTPPASSVDGGANFEPLNRVADSVSVSVGDQLADVLFAGLAPGLAGVYQLNVQPKSPITNHVFVSVNGTETSTGTLSVPVGTNVSNVSGSIGGLYPASGSFASGGQSTTGPVSFSALLVASVFQVAFDIKPGASTFQIVARNAAASDVIDIDPARGTWRATIDVPTLAQRVYDLSASNIPVIDFLTGRSFPGSIVPISRVDPIAIKALGTILLPNQLPYGSPISVMSGLLPANGHFVIDADTLSEASRFGGFTRISQGFGTSRSTKLQLFVDGLVVAQTDVAFMVD